MLFRILFVLLIFLSPNVSATDLTTPITSSDIQWIGKKVTGQHNGTLQLKSGHLTRTPTGQFSGGEFVIDMNSLTVTDIKDPVYNKKLLNHLKSNDFFSVDQYATAKLVITSVKVISDTAYEVTGNLTIKGITKPQSFKTTFSNQNGKVTFTSDIIIDRTLYDVRYKSGKFFQGLGDKLIYDDFELKVKIVSQL